ncbi:MAG TPA: thiol:disulfide interchange protein DsbA/DsbL [Steroidobacteraceae bacterium]|jgi:thiol:disulfide interchange protein DsbA|nr:thiol:disulfide interchange protein DsbA/DsbL [Steroidobacteraceae bacterium]
MRVPRVALLLCLALALGACGKQQTGAERLRSAPTSEPAPPAPSASSAQAAAQVTAQASKLNKDGSETVENAAGDSGAHNPLLAAVASTVAASTPAAAADALSGPTLWQEGVNYTRLVPAQPTDVPPGQVEVLEFFWYACPHCYALEPLVDAWKSKKPAYVTFVPVPVTWSDGHRALARLYYTLESLGKLDQLHDEVFKEIQVNGDPLVATDAADTAQTERLQTAFAVKKGISESAFKAAYHSMGVEARLQRADELVQRYRIDGVPTFVINGKYIADVRSAGGPERLMSLVSDLAAQEHKH